MENNLDPLTGSNPSTLTPTILAERLAMEKALREQADNHERELREAKELGVEKARQIQFDEYERRLTTLNHAHEAAVEAQAKTVPREMFDAYAKEAADRVTTAFAAANEKYDLAHENIEDRHEKDIDALRREIQEEREARKGFEGSMNTWKWLAGFLGASGVAGVIVLFATRAS